MVEPSIKTKQKALCQIGSFLQGSKKKHVKHRCNQHLGTWLIAGVPVWSCPVDEQNPEPVAMPYEPSQLATSRTSRNLSTRAPKNQWDRKLIFLFKKNGEISCRKGSNIAVQCLPGSSSLGALHGFRGKGWNKSAIP